MSDYSRDEIIDRLEKVVDIQFLYQERIINCRGPKSSKKEKYTEIAAGWIIDHIGKLQQITPIRRENSYCSKGHDGKPKMSDVINEKRIAIKMFNQKEIPGFGELLDYETPLNDRRNNKAGEIDLLAFDKDKKILRILELKIPNSRETMLHCVLEVYTYLKLVDREKLILDFNAVNDDKEEKIPEDTPIAAFPFVFRRNSNGEDGFQYREMQEDRPKLKKLMALLEITPLNIDEEINGLYRAIEL